MAVIGILIWRVSGVSSDLTDASAEKKALERDLLSPDGKKALDDIAERNVVPLYLSGLNKNVLSYKKDSKKDIYDKEKSAQVAEQLANLEEIGDYSFEEPLLAYNPFGTYAYSLYAYFQAERKSYVRYTVTVEDAEIPDFTRTCREADGSTLSKTHEITLVGLVPGQKNYIVMELYNHHDEVLDTMYYSIDVPESETGAAVKLATSKGRSKETISNGLYSVYAYDVKDKKKTSYSITLYDNSGILRGELPLLLHGADSVSYVYDTIIYACDSDTFVQISPRGQVLQVYDLKGYTYEKGFTADGFGNLYIVTSKNGRKTVNDVLLELELSTGKVTEVLDFVQVLDKVKEAAKSTGKKKKLDWIGINGVQVPGTDQIIVSCRELSSIIKVNYIHSRIPQIGYILADKSLWRASTNKGKVMDKAYKEGEEPEETEPPVDSILDTKEEKKVVFPSQFGQSQILYKADASLGEGQYYLYVMNNNYGEWKSRPSFSFAQISGVGTKEKPVEHSYYYRYLVDEAGQVYYLDKSVELPYIPQEGSVQEVGGHYLVANADNNTFFEMDKEGKLLTTYDVGKKLYQVEKLDWKDFWFQ